MTIQSKECLSLCESLLLIDANQHLVSTFLGDGLSIIFPQFYPSLLPGLLAFSLSLLYFIFHVVANRLFKHSYYRILLWLRNIQYKLIILAYNVPYNFISTYLSNFISSQYPSTLCTLQIVYCFLNIHFPNFHVFSYAVE